MTDKKKSTDQGTKDLTDKKNGYYVQISFVQPTVISGFIEGETEDEVNVKISEDFAEAECVKVTGMTPMDAETAKKMFEGPEEVDESMDGSTEPETTPTLQ